mmetsp:Transcript_45505/g.98930  ORF Transcript_45505/g.98930 Transcript_45505/m.98930 type:complete len:223 (-) Transcript_45505:600-1268(-)
MLPWLRWRHMLPNAPGDWSHVPCGQLVPCVSKGPVKLCLVLGELLDDLPVGRVVQERNVSSESHETRKLTFTILDSPLVMASRTYKDLPVLLEEFAEVLVAPLCWSGRPRPFESACEGVCTLAAAAPARPGIQWVLLRRRSGAIGAGTVRLAKGMAAANEGYCLSVIHVHASEGVPDLRRALFRQRLAHRAFRINVDEAYSSRTQGRLAGSVDCAGRNLLLQ